VRGVEIKQITIEMTSKRIIINTFYIGATQTKGFPVSKACLLAVSRQALRNCRHTSTQNKRDDRYKI